ncbi:hypothetical protein Cni_G23238 [Canna indica]|uniref:AIPP2-like SPOC-like domain-containing protein n=1 Tax=Canna indica TaxID=4628 RepID=A0AAQ3QM25_9LILI|nr:hypothetical protein Cni_G23238 [Canna indica]
MTMNICDICGVSGYMKDIVTCYSCRRASEHIYCMKILLSEVPEVWHCERCLSKAHLVYQGKMCNKFTENKSNVYRSDSKRNVSQIKDSPHLNNNEKEKVNVGRKRAIKKHDAKVKFIPLEEVTLTCARKNSKAANSSVLCRQSENKALTIVADERFSQPEHFRRKETKYLDVGVEHRKDKNKKVRTGETLGGVECYASSCKRSASKENVPPLTLLINPNAKFPSSPTPEACWRGSFEVFDMVNHVYTEIQGHFPSQVSHKAYEIAKKLREKLKLNMLPRRVAWPKLFELAPPTYNDIGLYFFSSISDRPREKYFRLLERIESQDCVMKTSIEDVELLIYSSKQLEEDCRRIDGETYLWGVFRNAKLRKKQHCRKDIISSTPTVELKSSNTCDQVRVVLEGSDHEVDLDTDMVYHKEIGGVNIQIGKRDAPRTFASPNSILRPFTSITTQSDVPPGFSLMSNANGRRMTPIPEQIKLGTLSSAPQTSAVTLSPNSILRPSTSITTQSDVPPGFSPMSNTNGRRMSPIPEQITLGTLSSAPQTSAATLSLFPSEVGFMKINKIGDEKARQNISADLSLSRPNYLMDGNACIDMTQKLSSDNDGCEEDLQLKL